MNSITRKLIMLKRGLHWDKIKDSEKILIVGNWNKLNKGLYYTLVF